MTGDEELGRGADPIPESWRAADEERAFRYAATEPEVAVEVHGKYDEPFDPASRFEEQRVHYVMHDEKCQGFVFFDGGCWWFEPRWPGSTRQEDRLELDVDSEADALLHGRRRVAWELAGD